MMRLLCVSVVAVGLVAGVLAGSAASAGSAAPVRYTASYSDPLFGNVKCVGVHLTGKNGTATSGGVDEFVCTISKRLTPGRVYTKADLGWCSDYFIQPSVAGKCVLASSFSIRVGGAGKSLIGRALYP